MSIAHAVRDRADGCYHVYVHRIKERDGSLQMRQFTADHDATIVLRIESQDSGERFQSLVEAHGWIEEHGYGLLAEFTGRGIAQCLVGRV